MTYQDQKLLVRELAKQYRELSQTPRNDRKRQNWADHNDLKGNTEPLLWICPDDDGGWEELVPASEIQCEDSDLKQLEIRLKKYLYHIRHFDDDFVFEPAVYFEIPGNYTGYHYGNRNQDNVWGLKVKAKVAGKTAYHLDNYMKTPEDFQTVLEHEVDFIPDDHALGRLREKYLDAVGGILSVDFHLPYSVLVQSLLIELVHMRGLEELMYDLYDNDELLMNILKHNGREQSPLVG